MSWDGGQARWVALEGRAALLHRAVLANSLALVHLASADDVGHLDALTRAEGAADIARIQERVLAPIDDPERSLTVRLIESLGRLAWGRRARTGTSVISGRPELEQTCAEAALRLLLVGKRAAEPRPVHAAADLDALIDGKDLAAWRALAAAAVAAPWTGQAERHLALISSGGRVGETAGLQAFVEMVQRVTREDERRAVAHQIRSSVESTGLSQREFAALIGTSPSRLSTYLTGAVAPSATMALRIARVARWVVATAVAGVDGAGGPAPRRRHPSDHDLGPGPRTRRRHARKRPGRA
ncbi:helix-turn-helix domain-containing protein [Nocardioides carbamazepini]|uniref:helix-turn-helix transcriptional regulator n=1 Tax=Nocardioides carbamazepini TaxID=2854259 RepID=UPI00214A3A81|nr:helix-turn-helix transcriptional regulator [Nocardioides carbamazepini]MCR1781143.1 helix-turn-helix domain-containing protein [Nocardioides carbamazepini]